MRGFMSRDRFLLSIWSGEGGDFDIWMDMSSTIMACLCDTSCGARVAISNKMCLKLSSSDLTTSGQMKGDNCNEVGQKELRLGCLYIHGIYSARGIPERIPLYGLGSYEFIKQMKFRCNFLSESSL
jgi:hypothetical protein